MRDPIKTDAELISSEDLLIMANQLISSIPMFGAFISTPIAGWISSQQRKNLQKFMSIFKLKCESIERSKVDKEFLDSEAFGEIILQVLEAAKRTSSDLRRNALANALLNSFVLPTSKNIGKKSFIRLIDQISDEEIVALQVLYESKKRSEETISLEKISEILQWSYEDTQVVVYGLNQLGLAEDPTIGTWANLQASINNSKFFRLSPLGSKCINYALQQ